MSVSRHFFLQIFVALITFSLIGAFSLQSEKASSCQDYCLNDGSCFMNDEGPACICQLRFTGERCELASDSLDYRQLSRNICNSIPSLCNGRGLCYMNSTTEKLSCKCEDPYSGDYCEKSDCVGYCLNGGTCSAVTTNQTQCACLPGYTGPRCETGIEPEECKYLPADYCKNGGSCTFSNGMLGCSCKPPFTGIRCEVANAAPTTAAPPNPTNAPGGATNPTNAPGGATNPTNAPGGATNPATAPGGATNPPGITCAHYPCRNGRPCYNNGNSYFCFCGSAYTGINCEIPTGK